MTIEQEKEQAKLCVVWLATHNMHEAEEIRDEFDPCGKRWNEDEAWEDAVEDAKEETLEDGAYLYKPSQEVIDYVKGLKAEDLWILLDCVTTDKTGTTFVLREV
jgi:hypothetical protein